MGLSNLARSKGFSRSKNSEGVISSAILLAIVVFPHCLGPRRTTPGLCSKAPDRLSEGK